MYLLFSRTLSTHTTYGRTESTPTKQGLLSKKDFLLSILLHIKVARGTEGRTRSTGDFPITAGCIMGRQRGR